MLYTPKNCNECGVELEADNRLTILGRRHCEDCEKNYKWLKYVPPVWVTFGVLGMLFGFGSYLKRPDKPLNLVTESANSSAAGKNQNQQSQSNKQFSANNNALSPAQKTLSENIAGQTNQSAQKTLQVRQDQSAGGQNGETEAVYMCGAQTKKGTACLRRVRGGGRCWQHAGQPAILPPGKLLVSR